MRVTVLGSAGSHPGPARACSSYLLESDGVRLLLDCGNGSMANLLQCCDPGELSAIVLSHCHTDHWADIIGVYLALRYNPPEQRSLRLYGPSGLNDLIAPLIPGDNFGPVLPYTAVAAGDTLDVGPFRLDLFASNHPVETLASRVSADGKVLAYSADSARTPQLTAAAKDADLFIADCTWPEWVAGLPPNMHMTGADAGRQATEAGARRLLVTHVWPSYDPIDLADEAAVHFSGRVDVAQDLHVFEV